MDELPKFPSRLPNNIDIWELCDRRLDAIRGAHE
jgi:hypothetical protein